MSQPFDGDVVDVADLSAAAKVEREQLAKCERQMDDISLTFAEWYAFYEDVAPDNAPREDLIELLRTAPNAFAQGLVYGKFTMRLEIAAITGREFQ